tara:strand:+ start:1055 stop:1369 length:315 start_codon:yes stop_codon:yes gene_type:complete
MDDLKEVLKNNPEFSLEDLKAETPELDGEWSFDERLTIPILRRLMDSYDELDMEDIKEMYLNPDFFDEEWNVQNDERTILKYISLIQFWKYTSHVGTFILDVRD